MTRGVDTPSTKRPTRTVLIIDDERYTLESFAQMLRLGAYTVCTADNAQDGLREAEAHAPDAIILDLRMPLTDGLEFLRQLRAGETGRGPRVAIVTGDYFVEDKVGADLRALGAEIHYKPLWFEDLVALAGRLVAVPDNTPPRSDSVPSTR